MSSQDGIHIYSKLAMDSIRLFRLYGSGQHGLSGTLVDVKLTDAPPYQTLSYCWGTQKQDVPVLVDGRPMYVTPNLAEALKVLCEQKANLGDDDNDNDNDWHPSPPQSWLWIDQICINQADSRERSGQVGLMGTIYSQAVRTLVWLGPMTDSCSRAWQLVDRIYQIFLAENPEAEFLADIPLRLFSADQHVRYGLPGFDDEDDDNDLWEQLRHFFQLPWFRRTWIIQEVALSQKDPVLLHGSNVYAWNRLGWAASWLRRNGYLRLQQIPNQIQNIDTISNIRRSRQRWQLDALLITASFKFHATDQRDKVYGMLGLASESQDLAALPDVLRPDYDLSMQSVYCNVALYIIRQSKSLSVWTRTSNSTRRTPQTLQTPQSEQLPSWVPDWSDFSPEAEAHMPRSLSWLYYHANGDPTTLGFPSHYKAAAGLPAELVVSEDPAVLTIRGINVDDVLMATPYIPNHNVSMANREEIAVPPLLRLWNLAVQVISSISSSSVKEVVDVIEDFIKATTADQHRLAGKASSQVSKDGSAYLLSALEKHNETPSDPDVLNALRQRSQGGKPKDYQSLAGNYCSNRSFFVTSRSRLGIGPWQTTKGDIVSVIYGGETPYILRPKDGRFCLLGESYVVGLMDGQATEERRAGTLTDEILQLV